jgi:hypothetical protein
MDAMRKELEANRLIDQRKIPMHGFFSDHRVILDTSRIKSSGHRMWRTGPLLSVHPRTSKAGRMEITEFHP